MAEVNAQSLFKVVEERKGQVTFEAVLMNVSLAYKKGPMGENGKRQILTDEAGNPLYHERLKTIQFKDDAGLHFASVFPEAFMNGVVPEVPGRGGLAVEITAYINDNDQPQIMAIRYDKGDTLVMSPAALKAIEAGGAIKL